MKRYSASKQHSGIPSLAQATVKNDDANTKNKNASPEDPLSMIPGLIFFGKTQPEAAKAFLIMVGYPLITDTIVEGIEKGGVKVGGKSDSAKKQNLYSILYRSPDFALVQKDTWGIVGWPGVSKKVTDEDSDQKTEKKNAKDEPGKSGESETVQSSAVSK